MPTGIVYDERCSGHCLPDGMSHTERPQRTIAIWDELLRSGLVDRCIRVEARKATLDELKTCHSESHIDSILDFEADQDGCPSYKMLDSDTYLGPGSATAALLAAGGLIDLCDRVVSGSLDNGISVLRPPGHHAGLNGPSGFCLFNNVAIAAKTIQKRHSLIKRILIFDWDVHHGNGTEEIFYEDRTVLFQSIHRGCGFYPCTGFVEDVGEYDGEGFSVNVPLPNANVGDGAYIVVMNEIFIPMAKEFAPDLIIVSAGFDAALGDPLGGMAVSPSGFGKMTAALAEVQPRIVLALEGGYNLDAISACATRCVQVLLDGLESGEIFDLTESLDSLELLEVISDVKRTHMPFWSCFQISSDEFVQVDAQAVALLDRIQVMTSEVYSQTAATSHLRSDTASETQFLTELDSSSDESEIENENV